MCDRASDANLKQTLEESVLFTELLRCSTVGFPFAPVVMHTRLDIIPALSVLIKDVKRSGVETKKIDSRTILGEEEVEQCVRGLSDYLRLLTDGQPSRGATLNGVKCDPLLDINSDSEDFLSAAVTPIISALKAKHNERAHSPMSTAAGARRAAGMPSPLLPTVPLAIHLAAMVGDVEFLKSQEVHHCSTFHQLMAEYNGQSASRETHASRMEMLARVFGLMDATPSGREAQKDGVKINVTMMNVTSNDLARFRSVYRDMAGGYSPFYVHYDRCTRISGDDASQPPANPPPLPCNHCVNRCRIPETEDAPNMMFAPITPLVQLGMSLKPRTDSNGGEGDVLVASPINIQPPVRTHVGRTALHYAVLGLQVDTVAYLVNRRPEHNNLFSHADFLLDPTTLVEGSRGRSESCAQRLKATFESQKEAAIVHCSLLADHLRFINAADVLGNTALHLLANLSSSSSPLLHVAQPDVVRTLFQLIVEADATIRAELQSLLNRLYVHGIYLEKEVDVDAVNHLAPDEASRIDFCSNRVHLNKTELNSIALTASEHFLPITARHNRLQQSPLTVALIKGNFAFVSAFLEGCKAEVSATEEWLASLSLDSLREEISLSVAAERRLRLARDGNGKFKISPTFIPSKNSSFRVFYSQYPFTARCVQSAIQFISNLTCGLDQGQGVVGDDKGIGILSDLLSLTRRRIATIDRFSEMERYCFSHIAEHYQAMSLRANCAPPINHADKAALGAMSAFFASLDRFDATTTLQLFASLIPRFSDECWIERFHSLQTLVEPSGDDSSHCGNVCQQSIPTPFDGKAADCSDVYNANPNSTERLLVYGGSVGLFPVANPEYRSPQHRPLLPYCKPPPDSVVRPVNMRPLRAPHDLMTGKDRALQAEEYPRFNQRWMLGFHVECALTPLTPPVGLMATCIQCIAKAEMYASHAALAAAHVSNIRSTDRGVCLRSASDALRDEYRVRKRVLSSTNEGILPKIFAASDVIRSEEVNMWCILNGCSDFKVSRQEPLLDGGNSALRSAFEKRITSRCDNWERARLDYFGSEYGVGADHLFSASAPSPSHAAPGSGQSFSDNLRNFLLSSQCSQFLWGGRTANYHLRPIGSMRSPFEGARLVGGELRCQRLISAHHPELQNWRTRPLQHISGEHTRTVSRLLNNPKLSLAPHLQDTLHNWDVRQYLSDGDWDGSQNCLSANKMSRSDVSRDAAMNNDLRYQIIDARLFLLSRSQPSSDPSPLAVGRGDQSQTTTPPLLMSVNALVRSIRTHTERRVSFFRTRVVPLFMHPLPTNDEESPSISSSFQLCNCCSALDDERFPPLKKFNDERGRGPDVGVSRRVVRFEDGGGSGHRFGLHKAFRLESQSNFQREIAFLALQSPQRPMFSWHFIRAELEAFALDTEALRRPSAPDVGILQWCFSPQHNPDFKIAPPACAAKSVEESFRGIIREVLICRALVGRACELQQVVLNDCSPSTPSSGSSSASSSFGAPSTFGDDLKVIPSVFDDLFYDLLKRVDECCTRDEGFMSQLHAECKPSKNVDSSAAKGVVSPPKFKGLSQCPDTFASLWTIERGRSVTGHGGRELFRSVNAPGIFSPDSVSLLHALVYARVNHEEIYSFAAERLDRDSHKKRANSYRLTKTLPFAEVRREHANELDSDKANRTETLCLTPFALSAILGRVPSARALLNTSPKDGFDGRFPKALAQGAMGCIDSFEFCRGDIFDDLLDEEYYGDETGEMLSKALTLLARRGDLVPYGIDVDSEEGAADILLQSPYNSTIGDLLKDLVDDEFGINFHSSYEMQLRVARSFRCVRAQNIFHFAVRSLNPQMVFFVKRHFLDTFLAQFGHSSRLEGPKEMYGEREDRFVFKSSKVLWHFVSPFFYDRRGLTPLHLAALLGVPSVVHAMLAVLEGDAEVNVRTAIGVNRLISARDIHHQDLGDDDELEEPFTHFASPRLTFLAPCSSSQLPPAHRQCHFGLLTEEFDHHEITLPKGFSALHVAAAVGNFAVIATLIQDLRTNLDARDEEGCTALHTAVRHFQRTHQRVRSAETTLLTLIDCDRLACWQQHATVMDNNAVAAAAEQSASCRSLLFVERPLVDIDALRDGGGHGDTFSRMAFGVLPLHIFASLSRRAEEGELAAHAGINAYPPQHRIVPFSSFVGPFVVGAHPLSSSARKEGSLSDVPRALNKAPYRRMDVNARDIKGATPLHWAGAIGASTAVAILLQPRPVFCLPGTEKETAGWPLESDATAPRTCSELLLEAQTDLANRKMLTKSPLFQFTVAQYSRKLSEADGFGLNTPAWIGWQHDCDPNKQLYFGGTAVQDALHSHETICAFINADASAQNFSSLSASDTKGRKRTREEGGDETAAADHRHCHILRRVEGIESFAEQSLGTPFNLVDFDAKGKAGETLLHMLGGYGDQEAAPLLLANGCGTSRLSQDGKGWTPLHHAAKANNDGFLNLLFSHAGCDPDEFVDYRGRTPLHVACAHDSTNAVKVLLRNGANPNARDMAGLTPLHVACIYSSEPCVVELLKFGLGRKWKTTIEDSDLDLKSLISLEEQREQRILARQRHIQQRAVVDVNAKSNAPDFYTPLHCVAKNFKNISAALRWDRDLHATTIAALLIEYGCNPHTLDGRGYSALHLAAVCGNEDLVTYLLQDPVMIFGDERDVSSDIRALKHRTEAEDARLASPFGFVFRYYKGCNPTPSSRSVFLDICEAAEEKKISSAMLLLQRIRSLMVSMHNSGCSVDETLRPASSSLHDLFSDIDK